jgi:AcrR family transcriptional regulator
MPTRLPAEGRGGDRPAAGRHPEDEALGSSHLAQQPDGAPGLSHYARQPGGTVVIPIDDPLSALPATAVRVLEATQRVVEERGFQGLTLNTVAGESGENKAMTAYYFGNKAGLVAALVDAVIHDECISAASRMRDVAEDERLSQLVAELRRMSAASRDFRIFFDILPHAIRNEELRARLATLYRWYTELKLDWLGIDRADEARRRRLRGLAQVMSALIDGLAIQALVDGDEFALEPAYKIVERLFAKAVPELLAEADPAE